MKKLFLILPLFLFLSAVTAYAHSGGTDANGGHQSPNGYHYHHGFPAHLHENDECPYDFEDATDDHQSGTSDSKGDTNNENSSRQNIDNVQRTTPTDAEVKTSLWDNGWFNALLIFGILIVSRPLCLFFYAAAEYLEGSSSYAKPFLKSYCAERRKAWKYDFAYELFTALYWCLAYPLLLSFALLSFLFRLFTLPFQR